MPNNAWPTYDPISMLVTLDTTNTLIVSNQFYDFTLCAYNGNSAEGKLIKIKVIE